MTQTPMCGMVYKYCYQNTYINWCFITFYHLITFYHIEIQINRDTLSTPHYLLKPNRREYVHLCSCTLHIIISSSSIGFKFVLDIYLHHNTSQGFFINLSCLKVADKMYPKPCLMLNITSVPTQMHTIEGKLQGCF